MSLRDKSCVSSDQGPDVRCNKNHKICIASQHDEMQSRMRQKGVDETRSTSREPRSRDSGRDWIWLLSASITLRSSRSPISAGSEVRAFPETMSVVSDVSSPTWLGSVVRQTPPGPGLILRTLSCLHLHSSAGSVPPSPTSTVSSLLESSRALFTLVPQEKHKFRVVCGWGRALQDLALQTSCQICLSLSLSLSSLSLRDSSLSLPTCLSLPFFPH
jgi:hypothetical protein